MKTEKIIGIDFARNVVESESMNPDYETSWVNKTAKQFEIRFGTIKIEILTFTDRIRRIEEN